MEGEERSSKAPQQKKGGPTPLDTRSSRDSIDSMDSSNSSLPGPFLRQESHRDLVSKSRQQQWMVSSVKWCGTSSSVMMIILVIIRRLVVVTVVAAAVAVIVVLRS